MKNKIFAGQFTAAAFLCASRRWFVAVIAAGMALGASLANAQQFAMSTTNVAPAQISDSQKAAVLRVSLSNSAATGVPLLQWDSIGLRLEANAGVALNAGATAALIATLEVYRDANGSGAFESGSDLLVAQNFFLPVAPDGGVNLTFDGSDPATLQLPAGTNARFFVVVTLTGNASSATPNTLRLTHLANGPLASTARNANTSALVTLTAAPDISTPVITATLDAPPVTTGLLPVVIQQPPKPALVSLHPAFQDAQESPAQLAYSVTANTNPGLVSFVGIDSSTGVLTLDPATGAQGQAQLTVQATDSTGKAVTTGLALHVGPLANYVEFASAYFGTGGPGISGVADDPDRSGLTNLLKYAFFLHPLKVGDREGLPTLSRTGNARVFSHLRPKFSTDLVYAYEHSSDLVTWVPAVSGVDYFAATMDLGDGSQRVECLLLKNPAQTFMRVKVQLISNPPPPGAGTAGGSGSGSAAGQIPPPAGLPPPPSDPPLPIDGGAVFPSESFVLGNLTLPSAVTSADLNNDGWMDLVSISEGDDRVSWYRNENGVFGPRQILSGQTRSGAGIVCADFTGDGLPEIASASPFDNKIAWYPNFGGGAMGGQTIITTTATYATAIAAADMDADGKIDIIAAAGYGPESKLVWFKNQGAPSYFIVGQENAITSQSGPGMATAGNFPSSIAVANIDGDPNGYADIAIASFNDSTVTFLRGNGANTFTRQVLSTIEGGAIEVALGDIDGDGLKDIVSISAYGIPALGQSGGRVMWYKNNGAAPFGPGQPIAIETAGLNGVAVADLNNDGKLDVLAATVRPPGNGTTGRLLWFRNLGGGSFGDPLTSTQLISTSGFEGKSVTTGDFDHNGMIDAAVAWQTSNKHSVYLNFGGQYSLTTTDTAPSVILESGRDDVLRISVTNNGVAGQDSARLATVGLLLEKAGGVAMNTTEANQLIDRLHFYADSNANGTFEPTTDQLIATIFHLNLTNGKASVPLGNAPPSGINVPPGTTQSFFVVPQFTTNAAAQNPNSVRLTHIASGAGASTTRAAYSGSLLVAAGPPPNVASAAVTAQSNATPTTIGLPNLTIYDPSTTSYLQLTNYFNDAEDGAALLKYTVAGNTNPMLFAFVGIEPGANRLSLKYRPGASGNATLAIRATDSLGKFVTASFQVTVGYTFTDWSSLFPPPSLGNWPIDTASIYAFGLNPLYPGDLSNAPKTWRQGSVKGIRHLRQRWSSDLDYSYLISADLQNWTVAVPGVHFYEFRSHVSPALDQSDVVILADWPRAFIRPRAVIP